MTTGTMTQAQMRVAIAEDVIKQVRANQYKPTTGEYLLIEFADDLPSKAVDLRDVIDLPKLRCEVCAKGAMLLSQARLFDGVPIDRVRIEDDDDDRITGFDSDLLAEIFGEADADLIERAFEGWGRPHGVGATFVNLYPDPADRLVAIMENLVAHDGIFTP